MSAIRKILAPTDCSEVSHDAMAYAIRLARQCEAEIYVLAVFDVLRLTHIGLSLYGNEHAINASNLDECQDELEDFIKPFTVGKDAPPVTLLHASGIPHEEIIGTAKDENIDLVVIGSSRKRGLRHVILGSVAGRVYRNAPCPVLVIPKGAGG